MRKRILALVLAVVMTVGLLPTAAFAEDEPAHTHKVCVGADVGSHECNHSEVTFTRLWMDGNTLMAGDEPVKKELNEIDAPEYVLDSGSYYLDSDVTLYNTLLRVRPDDDISLCLNGHKIDQTVPDGVALTMIQVRGKLALCDCSEDKSGVIAGDPSFSSRNGIDVYSGGRTGAVFIMYSGTISGNGGCGVSLRCSGQFNMNGGTISGNNGGVRVDSQTAGHDPFYFNMNGGEITGNTATGSGINSSGGGVCMKSGRGFFTMNGGRITGNEAADSMGDGGGVYLGSGNTFTMKGGEITGNKAGRTAGGVVLSCGTFTMTGGVISGNTACEDGYGYGGGVHVSGTEGSPCTFTMTGGKITGNTVSGSYSSDYGHGGGVYVRGQYRKSDWQFTMKSGEITGNAASTSGGGVYVHGHCESSDFIMHHGVITGNTKLDSAAPSNLYLDYIYDSPYDLDAKVKVAEKLTEGHLRRLVHTKRERRDTLEL